MGLFDKKYCDICGNKIKLLGNKKLSDANMCGDCAKKLSNWFTGRRQTSLDDIKAQLAYREENQAALASFKPTLLLGPSNDQFFRMEESTGKFIILREGEQLDKNPDIFDRSLVSAANLQIVEDRRELTTKNSEGKSVSFTPPHYRYSYRFLITIAYNGRFFDELNFSVSSTPVDGGADGEEYNTFVGQNALTGALANSGMFNVQRKYLPGGYRENCETNMSPSDRNRYNELREIGNRIVAVLTGQQAMGFNGANMNMGGAQMYNAGAMPNAGMQNAQMYNANVMGGANMNMNMGGAQMNNAMPNAATMGAMGGAQMYNAGAMPNAGMQNAQMYNANVMGGANMNMNMGGAQMNNAMPNAATMQNTQGGAWTCGNCGTVNTSKFCASCGAPRP